MTIKVLLKNAVCVFAIYFALIQIYSKPSVKNERSKCTKYRCTNNIFPILNKIKTFWLQSGGFRFNIPRYVG